MKQYLFLQFLDPIFGSFKRCCVCQVINHNGSLCSYQILIYTYINYETYLCSTLELMNDNVLDQLRTKISTTAASTMKHTCIPNFKFNSRIIQRNSLRQKSSSNCRFLIFVELALDEAQDKRRLSDGWFPEQDEFELQKFWLGCVWALATCCLRWTRRWCCVSTVAAHDIYFIW